MAKNNGSEMSDFQKKFNHDFGVHLSDYKSENKKMDEALDAMNSARNLSKEAGKEEATPRLKEREGPKGDSYARDVEESIRKRQHRVNGSALNMPEMIAAKAHKRYIAKLKAEKAKKNKKERREDGRHRNPAPKPQKISEKDEKKHLPIGIVRTSTDYVRIKKNYDGIEVSPQGDRKLALENADRLLQAEQGITIREGTGIFKNKVVREKRTALRVGKKEIRISTKKEKLNLDRQLGRLSARQVGTDMVHIYGSLGKKSVLVVGNAGKNVLKKETDKIKEDLKQEGGAGGELIAEGMDVAQKTKSAYETGRRSMQLVVEGGKMAVRSTQLTAEIAKRTYEGAKLLERKAVDATKKTKEFNSQNKGKSQNAIRERMQKAQERLKQEARKKAKEIAKKIKEKVEEVLVELLSKVSPVVAAVLVIAVVALVVFSLVNLVSSLVGGMSAMIAPLEDYNSFQKVVDMCEDYETQWNEYIQVTMQEDFTVPSPVCSFGNENTYEYELVIKGDAEDGQVAKFFLDPADIYCIAVAKFQDVNNLGEEYGNEINEELASKEEIESFILKTLEYYYPMDYMGSDDYQIEQELYECCEYLTYDYPEGEIPVDLEFVFLVESFKKPTVVFPDELYTGGGEWHYFVKTKVKIELKSFTDVLMAMGLTEEELENFAFFRTSWQSLVLTGEFDAPDWVYDTAVDMSAYDNMTQEELNEEFRNASVLDMTRAEFVEGVYDICSPSGQIPYVWGGSSYSGSDCSGFISLMLREAGSDISGWSGYLWENSVAVDGFSLQPGDLVFKQMPSMNGINHVGFYVGKGDSEQYCHCASGSGTTCNSYEGFVFYRRLIVRFSDEVMEEESGEEEWIEE